SPIDGTPVYETPQAFICETQHKGGKGFRLGRTMLGKTLPREQVAKLLKDGATDVIQGFRSKKTGRLFSASLHVDKSGKISFQFPPREKKAGSTSAKGKKAAATAGGVE
ncbi:MAG: topoisomerase C-terminal repeat-containing protein, partial [Opitutales bacterium]|nr:topoisomerase C-terminal repeat-containing protein [Opitutales bacterium]